MDRFIENYKRGFPFLKLVDAATVKNGGIKVMDQGEQMEASGIWESFEGRRVKFVPASGAASRMFKDLFEGLDLISKGGSLEKGSEVERFVEEIGKYPFYTPSMFDGAAPGDLLEKVVGKSGLNYGNMPKGEILFHRYKDHVRSAFEEHLVEGALYARDKDGVVRLHFTVSPDHQQGFESLFENVREMYESRFGCRYEVRFSVQDPSTDIIAVNEDNTPFLKEDGRPLYRPGGHGALLKNLNETDGEVIFLKNIDNVVHEDYIGESVKWKKILAGKLLKIRSEVFGLLNELDEESRGGNVSDELCDRIEAFLLREFCVKVPGVERDLRARYLHAKLNRPIRVCGMVKNEGEPGGGPFIVFDADGSTSLQILEGAQIDKSDPEALLKAASSTHFNPVDIVCSKVGYLGARFDLSGYTDPETGFISTKSYQGRKLKAQELPGLWNGAMSNWNTLFVEVPLITFNPVKKVFDLLRKEHIGK